MALLRFKCLVRRAWLRQLVVWEGLHTQASWVRLRIANK